SKPVCGPVLGGLGRFGPV
ncbi:hypothetical protein CP01DC11_1361B, partial [Chlamydia psittaci 01DC11]